MASSLGDLFGEAEPLAVGALPPARAQSFTRGVCACSRQTAMVRSSVGSSVGKENGKQSISFLGLFSVLALGSGSCVWDRSFD